jgi:hypothetical protein
MKTSSSALALVLGLSISLHAAESCYTKMVETKPVESNGLQFTVATEEQWVSARSNLHRNPVAVRIELVIHNPTANPVLFSLFDTFALGLKDSSGKRIDATGGRDVTIIPKPALIDAGGSFYVSRTARLTWNKDGKSHSLDYEDGTGSSAIFQNLPAGKYSVWFICYRSPTDPLRGMGGTPYVPSPPVNQWFGKVATNEAQFEIVDR